VTLLTDFGLDDAYVGVVKGVVLGVHPGARVVDLTHGVPPQDVRQAGILLADAYRFFPPGSVHLAVVDPGVGSPRRALAVAADGHYFVGPDNGLLGFLFEGRSFAAVSPTLSRYHRHPVSRTFQARDIFAPIAAHLARGVRSTGWALRSGTPSGGLPPWPGGRAGSCAAKSSAPTASGTC
jgi:S-adenosylmethionine hydrolase